MKRCFTFFAGMDISVKIEVDLSVMTPELATEINNFWSGAQEVLDASEGDIVQAVARRAAGRLMWLVMDTYDAESAMAEFNQQEGWPPNGEHGIRLVEFDLPSMDAVDLDCEELNA